MIVRSLRVRIVAIAVVLVCVVLALTGVGVVGAVQRRFEHDLDESLRQRAEQVIGQAGSEASDPIVDSPVIGSIDVDRFAQVIRADGTVVSATRNVAGQPALAPAPSVGSDFSTRDDLSIEDDVYRVLVRPIPGGAGYVVVAQDIDDLNDNIRSLTVALLIAFPVAIVLLAVAVWWLVGRTLRPVEAIRREVADVALDHLDRRIAVPGSRDEVARLATTMNEMLGRLEVAAEQQRRFVADASHELRTPLTRLRTALEVDLAGAGTDLASTCRDALDGTVEMQRLVDDLLFLARHDAQAGALPAANLDPVDLDVVVDEEVRALRAVSDTSCRIEMSGVTAAVVRGHRGQLRRLVANLLSNAVRHAAASVVVSLAQNGDTVRLSVADDGTGIPPDQRERVFERFVRVGEARSAHDGGAGLGLAIARDIARSHGGTIRIVGSPLGGVLVQVELPAAG